MNESGRRIRRTLSGLQTGWLTLVALAGGAGCAPPPESSDPPPLVAEEVGAAVDDSYRPDEDERAAARPPELKGLLPGDYPPDLPVYARSSLYDFGAGDEGDRFIVLHTVEPPAKVLAAVEQELLELGWRRGGEPEEWEKNGRRARVRIAVGPPTALRIDYPPRR